MFKTILRNTACVTVALLGLAICVWPASATTIYYDTFTAADGTALNGHTPDVTTGDASWSSVDTGAVIYSDHLYTGYAAAASASTLPFTPESGKVYTLSMDIKPQNYYDMFVGFSDDGSGRYNLGYWLYLNKDAGTTTQLVTSPMRGVAGTDLGNVLSNSVFTNISFVLDTTAAVWKTQMYYGTSSSPAYSYTYTGGNPTINGITIWHDAYSDAQVDNLTLTATPEPTMAALLVTGLIGLLAYAWRKRR